MKVYITYFLISLFTLYIITFNLGFSDGFVNIIPILALLGSVILFIIGIPFFVYNSRIGAFIACFCFLLILPYIFGFTFEIISDIINGSKFNFIILLILLPSILVILGMYFSVKTILNNKPNYISLLSNKVTNILLAIFPIFLFVLYLIFYIKYWGWEMFIVK